MTPGKENIQKPYGIPSERSNDPEIVQKAHEEADKDIAADPDLSQNTDPNNDLDEGELARLGENKTDLI